MASSANLVASFFPPNPWAYSWLLHIFQWLPAGSVGQWFTDYHPCGKFSRTQGFNINGRLAWCVMESVGPVHMLYILRTLPQQQSIAELPLWNKIAAALYLIHYFNRAVIGPLFVAPSMSPVGVEIFIIVSLHNWFNSAVLAGWLAGYETEIAGFKGLKTTASAPLPDGAHRALPYIGLAVFLIGMTNNIRGERKLWSMRREEAHRRAAAKSNKEKRQKQGNIYSKVYVIPPAEGLFRYSLYPHYFWEWIEWFGYVLIGTAVMSTSSAATGPIKTPKITVAPWLAPLAAAAQLFNIPFPLPPLAYVLNFIAAMLPQARRGLRWYKQKFGEQAVDGRSAIVPGIPFL